MDRRAAIKRTVLLTGAALSASTITAVMQGCQAEASTKAAWVPQFFDADQAATLSEVAETILPATDTPGAKDVGVPEFIDRLTATCLKKEEQETLTQSLADIQGRAQAEHGKAFPDLPPEARLSLLNHIDTEAREAEIVYSDIEEEQELSGFLKLKQLILLGYFTSEKVGTEVTAFLPLPGQYKPCMPYEAGQPAWTY
ncbi:MAG: gluconate 2-dehydrogenase subunit 3 family protein [Phaeodactylibacter sp.]|uniref:gluconate 2-dehydrogenase subunit 3 family protein n=1 Tax=Phaeodactylibacter sp. TaxID=1940289 RepID=UPI0032EB6606